MQTIKTAPAQDAFRTQPTAAPPERVDRVNNVIYGASVMQAGDLNDGDARPWTVDTETLSQIVAYGQAARGGIKARMTHPNMSNDGMGSYLGKWQNFRLDGDTVRADLHIADAAFTSPQGDLGNYVMDMAEQDPEAFGVSVATRLDQASLATWNDNLQKMDRDKRKAARWPMRFAALKAGDIVDSPAATRGGLFSLEADLRNLPAQATALLDTYFSDASPDVVRERINGFLDRYLATKGHDMTTETATPETPPAAPAADLSAVGSEPVHTTPTADLAASERERCLQIAALCNVAGVPDKFSAFVNANFSVPQVQEALKLVAVQKGSALSNAPEPAADPDAKYKAEFAANREHITCSEEQWIRTRKIDDGIIPLQSR